MTLDLTITGSLSRSSEAQGDCLWCGKASTSRAWAPGLGVEVPMHILCCGAVIVAYRRWQESGIEAPRFQAYRLRMTSLRMLGPGGGG